MFQVEEFENGYCVIGDSTDQDVIDYVKKRENNVQLIACDPPYGNIVKNSWDRSKQTQKEFADWMIDWTRRWSAALERDAALYVWGGIGIPEFRPYIEYLSRIEAESNLKIANLITWKKRRAYGVQHNYLFTREECVYLFNGTNIKKPRVFNVPYLEEERGYEAFNKKYPAKSRFKRRSNVWSDITELFSGKIHIAQKPKKLYETLINTHTTEGETVLDMFAGSGTCALAAIDCNRRFIIIENDCDTAKATIDRIREHERQHIKERND